MAKGKNVLTTGAVAKICNVAPRTVSKWFDNGRLKGYRIPGSKDRRIPVNELVRFMKANDMPLDAVPVGKMRILIVDSNQETALNLAGNLSSKADYDVKTVTSEFETGFIAQKFSPHVLLVNLLSYNIDAIKICKTIRDDEDLQTIKVIAITNELRADKANKLLQKGFDAYVTDSADIAEIIRIIEETTAIVY